MMSSISRVVRAIRCWWPSGRGGAPGRVTSIRSATSFASSSTASRRCELCSISASSSLRALLAAPPTGPRSSGGSCAIPRRICVSSAFRPRNLTRRSSSSALEEAATIASVPATRSFSICSSTGPPLWHHGRRYPRAALGGEPLAGDRRRGGHVERLGGTLERDRRGHVTGGEDIVGESLPLGTEAEGGGAGQALEAVAAVGDERGPRRRRARHVGPRRGAGEDR